MGKPTGPTKSHCRVRQRDHVDKDLGAGKTVLGNERECLVSLQVAGVEGREVGWT